MNQSLKIYQNRTRVRVCGICFEQDRLLLIKHDSLGSRGYVWIPPGGGTEFGTSLKENLIREFKEETGLIISVTEFLFMHEFISKSLHAIEIFFKVKREDGQLQLGSDPELNLQDQIIREAKFMSFAEINQLHHGNKHQLLKDCENQAQLLKLRGYFRTDHRKDHH